MKRILLFMVVLGGGVVVSAWMGIADSKHPGAKEARALNTFYYKGEPVAAPATVTNAVYQQVYRERKIYQSTRSLVPIATHLGSARPGEWRGAIREPKQSYSQFVQEARHSSGGLVIQPIGSLPLDQRQAIGHVLDAMEAFFGVRVQCASPIALSSLPYHCFRNAGGTRQINAEALMDTILEQQVGGPVASVLGITTLDLFPGDRWAFESTLGWSSFSNGTAVLSTRNILSEGRSDRGKNLYRMIKMSVHELAHTYGLKHCADYSCLMNGCSDLKESDSKLLVLCPDCLAKLSLAAGRELKEHLDDMLVLCRSKGFSAEARYYAKALQMLR